MTTASLKYTVPQKLSIRKQLEHLSRNFTKPSYSNLCGIIRSCLSRQGASTLSNMANDVGKGISTISYFFNDAVWNITEVRESIRSHCLRSPLTNIEEGDIAAIDESSISKKGNAFQ